MRRGIILLVLVALCVMGVRPTAAQTTERCFSETGFCINGRIRAFWEQNGGLPVFGFPTSPQQTISVEGRQVTAQSFERNRLELHPENRAPFDVLLGRLGAEQLTAQGRDWFQFAKGTPRSGCRFFAETGHSVCDLILAAYRAQGLELDGRVGKTEAENLALFGMPLSEVMTERLSDGKEYLVQWFERARFELHPENQAPYNVLLGLLGNESRGVSAPSSTSSTDTPAGLMTLSATNHGQLVSAVVVKVVDGDTIDARVGAQTVRLRLIGMDTPEVVDPRKPVQCYGREASDEAKRLLSGQTIQLEADATQGEQDKYGRLLRYVWLSDGTSFNQQMIARGFAFEYTYQIPYKYQNEFKAAQQAARDTQRGLWSPTTCNAGASSNTTPPNSAAPAAPSTDLIAKYDHNGDGKITCGDFTTYTEALEAFRSGFTRLDSNGDEVPCESLYRG